ncbi:protein YpfM, partial [Escherichia coli]|nr:protein YpfM [Escherichia coli]
LDETTRNKITDAASAATLMTEMPAIIREVVMIERELGNWKDFIEVMLRK